MTANHLIESENAPRKPIHYEWRLTIDNNIQKVQMEFQAEYRKRAWREALEGYTYSYNGRAYQDVASLWAEESESLSKNAFIGVDAYGGKVLKTYESIPTFDCADREWDSKEVKYLFFDGKNVHLVVMRGGYRIASLTFYENLQSADILLKPLFEKLGWPEMGIRWK